MEFKEVIKNRYSCKKFSDKKVEKEKITKVLEAGRLAPTAKNLQEQKIYVVESSEGLAKVDKCTPCRYGAPTVIVVAYDKNNVFVYPGEKRDSGIEDATIVATHILLALENEGLNACWVNFFNPDDLKNILNLPSNEEILMIFSVGYKADDFKALPAHTSRKPLSETVKYI